MDFAFIFLSFFGACHMANCKTCCSGYFTAEKKTFGSPDGCLVIMLKKQKKTKPGKNNILCCSSKPLKPNFSIDRGVKNKI